MRRMLVAAMAAATLMAPLADALAQGRGNGRGDDRRGERRAERSFEREAQRAPRGAQGDRRAYQAPPPQGWNRGQVLPPPYRGGQIQDFDRHRLRPPPHGYNWVRVGPDIYLTQRSTGLVVEAIPGGY
jgi:Ni/Co efflux regulator RcnB